MATLDSGLWVVLRVAATLDEPQQAAGSRSKQQAVAAGSRSRQIHYLFRVNPNTLPPSESMHSNTSLQLASVTYPQAIAT